MKPDCAEESTHDTGSCCGRYHSGSALMWRSLRVVVRIVTYYTTLMGGETRLKIVLERWRHQGSISGA